MRSSRKPLLALAFVGTLIALPALAQPSASSYPAACEASKVSKSDVERAHTVFLSGKQYLEESNYDKAISYFKDAYSIDCSIHAILPIIATAYERKGDKGEAVLALEEYQRRAPTAPDHEVVERRIRNLKDQLARDQAPRRPRQRRRRQRQYRPRRPRLPLRQRRSRRRRPDGSGILERVGDALGPSDGRPQRRSVGGGRRRRSGRRGGHRDVRRGCGRCIDRGWRVRSDPNVLFRRAAAQGNKGRSLETLGVVSGTVGLASVVAGIVAHFVEKTGGPPGTSTGTQVSPVVAPGYGGLALGGAF